jgi:hypothetical protein
LKATAPSVAFPGWDLDPSMLAGPVVGLGPTANLGIDLLLVTLSGCILALAGAGGAVVRWWQWVLLLAGLAAVTWHARFAPDAAQDHLTLGSAWAGAMCAGLSISAAARFENVARLTAGVLFGSIAFFALKAGVQVFVENPQTIEMFKANREAMLAAQGWTPDSFAAKAFERRLYDAPGTGWLGLSNVLSTAGACGRRWRTGRSVPLRQQGRLGCRCTRCRGDRGVPVLCAAPVGAPCPAARDAAGRAGCSCDAWHRWRAGR